MKQLDKQPLRTIRSFVIREGRFTAAQKKAFDTLWPKYGIVTENKSLLNLSSYFKKTQPTILDIGFGSGDSLISLAQQQPDFNFVGVEVYRPGIGAALRKIETLGINNIRIINHDAVELVSEMISEDSLHGAVVWFPDPWPKKRHHKRRLLQISFFNQLVRVIKNEGILHLASDWQDYVDYMTEHASKVHRLILQKTNQNPLDLQRPSTRFEQRGLKRGHQVTDLIYQIKK